MVDNGLRAGPGGGGGNFPAFDNLWSDLVYSLIEGFNSVMYYIQRLLYVFTSPFSDLIQSDEGLTGYFLEFFQWVLEIFGVDVLNFTPLEFMLGSTMPIIIIFTIYRYVKQ